MERLLEGKPVVAELAEKMTAKVAELKGKGIETTMIIIRVGARPDDVSYEKGILKNCEKVGIKTISDELPMEVTPEELISHIEKANKDDKIHGIMMFRPLPKHIDQDAVQNAINPKKDIDCITNVNLAKVFDGTAELYPCTPQAVVTLLKFYEVPLKGKNVVVVGRSLVVGKPLAMLLLKEDATVTICHSRTENLEKFTQNADVVVAAMGKAKILGAKYFNNKSVIADVGINFDPEAKKIVGDVDFENVKDLVNSISPSLGGIGLVTTNTLLSNTVNAAENLSK